MTKKEKIIACYGHLKLKSIAIICDTSLSYVQNVISNFVLIKLN